jgi:START-like superfamily domain
MSEKEKFEMEFEVNSSTSVLFNMISTPSGLSEWFADDVNIKEDLFTFIWDGSVQQARLVGKKKGESVKFQWIDDYEDGLKTYFEFAIKVDDLTNDVALMITDFADSDEIEEAKRLWGNQIQDLKTTIGSF